jgi:hypothetical protein
MSIFTKSITAITADDLKALVTDQAAENIRLEFKSAAPPKDEMLKKLSSFANTYGGYLIVGAAADASTGRVHRLVGVDPINGFRQQIVQWCYDGVWPPLEVFVSDPIAAPDDASKVCYVVEVPLSAETPHFLNGRKGAYVRTDEFSQRFEPQLAKYEELTHLADRRAALVQRRDALFHRSLERFDAHVRADYAADKRTTGAIGATLILAVSPQYPYRQLIDHPDLMTQFETHHIAWRQEGFPAPNRQKISAHESMLIPGGAFRFSLVEISVWGHLFYAVEMQEQYKLDEEGREKVEGIHFHGLLGTLMVFLEHANSVLKALGYDGPLLMRVQMLRIRDIPFLTFSYNRPTQSGASPFDDTLSFEVSSSSSSLATDRDTIVGEIARTILLGLNWPALAIGKDAVKGLVAKARDYSLWTK